MAKSNERFPNFRQDGTRQCVWCGTEIKPPSRRLRWCSDECIEEYRTLHDFTYAKTLVWERDKGVCAICGINTQAERERWRLLCGDVIDRMNNVPQWSLDREKKKSEAVAAVMKAKKENIPTRVWTYHGWPNSLDRNWHEVDHIVPRYLDGTNELSNLRTLCVPCHKAVTARQALDRKKERDREKKQCGKGVGDEATPTLSLQSQGVVDNG